MNYERHGTHCEGVESNEECKNGTESHDDRGAPQRATFNAYGVSVNRNELWTT